MKEPMNVFCLVGEKSLEKKEKELHQIEKRERIRDRGHTGLLIINSSKQSIFQG
jgi:hypothetical protein